MVYWMDKEMLKLIVELWGEKSIQAELHEALQRLVVHDFPHKA